MSAKGTMDIVFKILEVLEQAMDYEDFEWRSTIGYEALGISENRWCTILEMMQQNNLIQGFSIKRGAQGEIIESGHQPRITLQGIKFLIENSRTAKIIEAAKLIKDFIP